MEQHSAPLWDAVRQYVGQKRRRFHLPGHKGTASLGGRGRVGKMDLTELPGLDDLHSPTGTIAAAQATAAAWFGADQTYFLVNGCTAGIQAMILATVSPGQRLILPRHAHRAVLGALVAGGIRPRWLSGVGHPEWEFPLGVAAQAVEEALAEGDAAAVFVPHPVYQGVVSDLARIVGAAHGRGVAVLVDEAHGTHFGLDERLPMPALRAGADAVVQGTHKTGGALTQGAMLHLRGQRVPAERVRRALDLLQTTSPSYLLLVSLDLARRHLATRGRREHAALLDAVLGLRDELGRRGVRLLGPEDLPAGHALDPERLTVAVGEGRGPAAARRLAEEYGIQVEYAGADHLVAVTAPADTPADLESLAAALATLGGSAQGTGALPQPGWPTQVLTPREAVLAPAVAVPLARAVGEVAAEPVAVYPPGTPVLWPGEAVTAEVVAYLEQVRARGLHLQGVGAGGCLAVVGTPLGR